MADVDVAVITPVKNEREHLPALAASVADQTLAPSRWIIVDDGSTDGSEPFIRDLAASRSAVDAVHRSGTSEYDIGRHYANVLADGFRYLTDEIGATPAYYMILDGDMRLSPAYIETVVDRLEANDSLAIASGGIYVETDGGLELEYRASHQPAGGATLYRGPFYRDIGGPPVAPCVDSVTKTKARLRGYECRYFSELDVEAVQARPTGQKGSVVHNQFQRGRDQYILNHHPITIVAKTMQLTLRSPHYHSVGFCCGYFYSALTGVSRIEDPQLRRYYWEEKPRELWALLRDKAPLP